MIKKKLPLKIIQYVSSQVVSTIFTISQNFVYENEAEIEQELKCSVCWELLEDPRTHPTCGNMFCVDCISKVQVCPLCRFPIVRLDTVPRYVINKINSVPIIHTKCYKMIKLENLKQHNAECGCMLNYLI